ncbi:ParB/RepB/Spo0J family partition protein [Methylotenera sp.]|uniref:ParB/RepB/Spo0J family partition protein n=1 Tax=Methylotenera sp. TaxID=2051956 RepID=UPI0027200CDB|nr:ParB/RepB/Spo0J family partition protein [Methylotenera sp.]MDO9205608.1 ParB/RepB/Spo0J family partition protein [Methylotenera sp.]MDP2071829.1 ParB/RepB/Spo0J family partition protein [Methylotenera sp.]
MNTANTKKKTFDLGAFDNVDAFNLNPALTPENQLNVVLAISLNKIIEDENQPRKDFNDINWDNFVADIKKNQVRNPIHVRPEVNGIYKIINGARRYRGSLKAGLSTIPCIIQEDEVRFDDYAQVLDNITNEEIPPMDIALFIQKRIAAGDSKSYIAEQLSENSSYITVHLALTEMPSVVENAYNSGKVNGARLIYQLNKLYAENPAVAESIINSNDEITNSLIIQARKSLVDSKDNLPEITADLTISEPPESTENTQHNTDNINEFNDADSNDSSQDEGVKPDTPVTVKRIPFHNPDNEEPPSAKLSDPNKIKNPLLLAHYQSNQACVVMLHERPTETGFIWIKLEDTGEKIEVLADTIKLNLLTEAQGRE